MNTETSQRNVLIPNSRNLMIWINTLLMLCGLFIFHWRPEMMLLAYFLETIIIGVLHVVKMVVIHKYSPAEKSVAMTPFIAHGSSIRGIRAIVFFILHYFFFVAVQSIFIFAFVSIEFDEIKVPYDLVSNYAWVADQSDILQAFGFMVVTTTIHQLFSYYLPCNYRIHTLSKVFIQPYLRVLIQQFVVILGGAFIFFSQSIAAAVVLILIRHVVDLYLNAASGSNQVKEKLISQLTSNEINPEEAARQKDELRSILKID